MNPVEALAAIAILASVWLTVRRSLWLWPVGIAGTLLYGWVFLNAKLYFSSGLQAFFLVVQVYGWWFWATRSGGREPPIVSMGWAKAAGVLALTGAVAGGLGWGVGFFSDAKASLFDGSLTGLSIVAQALLSRKVLENWLFWIVTDVISIGVYGSQGLYVTAALYALLLCMACWGLWTWLRADREATR